MTKEANENSDDDSSSDDSQESESDDVENDFPTPKKQLSTT